MPTDPRPPGIHLGTISGVPVHIGYSWLGLAAVVIVLVGPSIASSRPDLGVLAYGVAAILALFLLVAVLAHEAAHAIAARLSGLTVHRVVADLWGGHTAYDAGAATPRSTAGVAVAGPIANVLCAVVSYPLIGLAPLGIGSYLAGGFVVVNAFLAAFNLLPGLPLDGGQLVQSAVWAWTKDRHRGQVAAGYAGLVVTVLVVAWFIGVPWVQSGRVDLVDSMWVLLIAWFLWRGARAAISSGRVRGRVAHTSVGSLVEPATVWPADTVLSQLRGSGLHVVADPSGRPAALVDADAMARVPRQAWDHTPVSSVARTQPPGWVVEADPAGDVMPLLGAVRTGSIPVILVTWQGRLVGATTTDRLMTALSE